MKRRMKTTAPTRARQTANITNTSSMCSARRLKTILTSLVAAAVICVLLLGHTDSQRVQAQASGSCATVSFAPAQNYGVGTDPRFVTTGDFNADGKLDLATANANSDNVSILLGDGLGGFAAATNVGAGNGPRSVTTGDFNADGKLDLTTANFVSDNVSVLLGDGLGGFAAAVSFGVGDFPQSITTGDFNADGKPDLATANSGSANVSVLLGDGSGGFGAATNYATAFGPLSVAVGDFNGDGKPDLATANFTADGVVSVLLGDGGGGFGAASFLGTGNTPTFVAVGDFNGDGKPDLATAHLGSDNVSILLGDGLGGFAAATSFGAGDEPFSVTTGDFNADGKLDLATANANSDNVSILLGDGLGGFAAAVNFGAGDRPGSITAGDFNGDGKLDLATANLFSDYVSVLLNNCTSNTAPTITALTVTRTVGAAASNAQIATVSDAQDAENTLSVTAPLASGSGVTLSGISIDASGNVTANVAASCAAMTSTFTLQVTDSGSLSATATLTVTVTPETTPPVLSCPANVVVYLPPNSMDTGMMVNFPAPTATDNCSATPTITTSHGSGSIFPVGVTTVNVTAKDAANNQASCSFTVTVRYNFSGFFQPVDNAPTVNSVNAGSAIPVKFSLSGNKGLNIFAAGYPQSQQIACSSGAPVDTIEETVTAGASSLSYDATTGQYKYVWKTDKAWKGTCRKLIVQFNDGSIREALIQFK
jgi:HYR domain/FG-GAP-like repeat/FG-GAP repeat